MKQKTTTPNDIKARQAKNITPKQQKTTKTKAPSTKQATRNQDSGNYKAKYQANLGLFNKIRQELNEQAKKEESVPRINTKTNFAERSHIQRIL